MAYYCNVWVGAPNFYLDLWSRLQKQIDRLPGPALTASLDPLSYSRNEAILSLLVGITFKILTL